MLLTANRLFTGTSDDALHDQVIEIGGERIVDVRPSSTLASRDELTDLGDATILPGLIDVHQHLAFDASIDPVARLEADDDATLLLRMRLAALRALSVGITTIRGLGDRSYLSLTLRDWFLGGEVEGLDAMRRAVRDRAARGVDVIKVMASGGNLTPTVPPHESQLGYTELLAAADEAHAAGLPLAVHAHGGQAVADALAVGADSIEHCTFFSADGIDADPEMLQRLAESSCVISMTAAVVPDVAGGFPARQERLAAVLANHETLYRSGSRIVCSSDGGVAPIKPHTCLPYGVSTFLPSIGMTNAEAIGNVTAFAAEVCPIEDRRLCPWQARTHGFDSRRARPGVTNKSVQRGGRRPTICPGYGARTASAGGHHEVDGTASIVQS